MHMSSMNMIYSINLTMQILLVSNNNTPLCHLVHYSGPISEIMEIIARCTLDIWTQQCIYQCIFICDVAMFNEVLGLKSHFPGCHGNGVVLTLPGSFPLSFNQSKTIAQCSDLDSAQQGNLKVYQYAFAKEPPNV